MVRKKEGIYLQEKETEDPKNFAPTEPEMTIDTDARGINERNTPGDSVNEHESLETANSIIAAGEIGQQNENL
ncbi:hypothetical protein ABXS71_10030 [Bacillus infantis]